MGTDASALVEFLETELGDDLRVVIEYGTGRSDVRYGEAWFDEFVDDLDGRTAEMMHREAVSRLDMAEVGEEIYETRIDSDIRVHAAGIGVHLYPGDGTGVFVFLRPDADIRVRSFVDDCLDALGAPRPDEP